MLSAPELGQKIKDVFRRNNPNGSAISTEELKKVLLTVARGALSEDELDRMLYLMEKNKDGHIQSDAFVDWVITGSLEAKQKLGLASKPHQECAAEAAQRLCVELGGALRICILGSTRFRCEQSEALVKAVACKLSASLGRKATFVTGGLPGVQKVFAEHCGYDSQLFNLLPYGHESAFGAGRVLHAGADMAQRQEVMGLMGDVYITVEGGQGVAKEATAATQRGATVLPLMRTGGASAGMFDFPRAALERPSCASERQWELLRSADASVEESADALAAIAASLVAQR